MLLEMFAPGDVALDVIVSPAQAAVAAGVPEPTLRCWASRPNTGIKRYPAGYRLSELRAWHDRRNTRMIRHPGDRRKAG